MKEVKQTENGGRKMTLEEQIKHYRKQAGLSQEKMAEKHLTFWDLLSTVAKTEKEVSYQKYRLQERSLSKRSEPIRIGFMIIGIDRCER